MPHPPRSLDQAPTEYPVPLVSGADCWRRETLSYLRVQLARSEVLETPTF